MKALAVISLAVLSLAAIGWGLWQVYPPAAAITLGGLVWADLQLWGRSRMHQPPPPARPLPPDDAAGVQP